MHYRHSLVFPRTMEMKIDLWNGYPIKITKQNKNGIKIT